MKINKILSTTAITAAAIFMGTANNANAICELAVGGGPATAGDDNLICTATSTGIDGLAGNDTVLNAPTGTVTGSLLGGDGDDTLQNQGTLTGNMNGNAGNDSIQNNAVMTGNINGGTGNDSVAIGVNTGSISGIIDTGDGDDAVQINGTLDSGDATIAGVITGAGNDTVIFGSDSISPAIGGSVVGITATGDGDDAALIVAGTITGNFNLGDGTDQFLMGPGAATGSDASVTGDVIFGGSLDVSNESFQITDGTFDGNVRMGAGDDRATVDNAGVLGGSIANVATAIFDGDSFTEIGNDSLTYIYNGAVIETVDGGNIINWETIDLQRAGTSTSSTVSLVGGNTADIINFDSVDNLGFVAGTVSGTINMLDGNDTLLVDLDNGGVIGSSDGGNNTGTVPGSIDVFGLSSSAAQTIDLGTQPVTNYEALAVAGGGTFTGTGTISPSFNDVVILDANTELVIPSTMDVAADIGSDNNGNILTIAGTISGDADTTDNVISMNGGDDTVNLQSTGSINGTIALGTGNDVLDATNATINAAAVAGGPGDDSVISGVSGVNESLLDLGTGNNVIVGTIDNDGTIIGPVSVTGDLDNTDGVLIVEINGTVPGASGTSGVTRGIDVAGNATLGGAVDISEFTGTSTVTDRFEVGETFDVVTAAGGITYDGALVTNGNISGTVQGNVTIFNTGTGGGSLIVQQLNNALRLTVAPTTNCGSVSNQYQPYQDVCTTVVNNIGDQDMLNIISAISNNPDGEAILQQLLPEGYLGMAQGVARAKDAFMTMVDYRMGELRAMRPFPKRDRDNGVWVRAVYDQYTQDSQGTKAAEVDTSAQGIQIGYDHRLDYEGIIGITAGFSQNEVENDVNFEGESDVIALGLYGTYRVNNFHVDAMGTYVMAENDVERNINIPSSTGDTIKTARSDFDSKAYGARLGIGYDFQFHGGFEIGPFGELKYNVVEQDGTNETGADLLSLKVSDYEYESLKGKIGARATYDFVSDDGEVTVVPSLRAAYVKELMDPEQTIDAYLAGEHFTTNANTIPEDLVELGIGITTILNDTYGNGAHSIYGHYETQISLDDPDATGQTASVGYKFKW